MTDAQLDANGNYIGGSLTYQNVNSVTLTGGSAAIFLNPTSSSLTVATPAQAAANPVTGTSVALSVLGQENGSDSGLTYTWSSSGPAGVTFSANGTNGAKNTTAAFVHAGAYTLTATISDGSQSVTSSVVVTVNQTLTTLQVSPASASVPDGGTRQFSATALDQFGIPLATQPAFTWSVDAGGVGTVNSNGLYTAPPSGVGSATVRAISGATSASATVSVVASSGTATFVKKDTTTQGNWKGVYGAQGYNIIGNAASLPTYATVTPAGQANGPGPPARPIRGPSESQRLRTHRCLLVRGHEFHRRRERDRRPDAPRGAVLPRLGQRPAAAKRCRSATPHGQVEYRTVTSFHSGVYLDWAVSGNVNFRSRVWPGPMPSSAVSSLTRRPSSRSSR